MFAARLRRYIVIVLAGALLITVALTGFARTLAPFPQAPVQLTLAPHTGGVPIYDDALNNGFEQADGALPAGWLLNHAAQARFAHDTTMAHSGTASARIEGSGGDATGLPAFYITPRVLVTPGQTYTTGAWVRGRRASGETLVELDWVSADDVFLGRAVSRWLPPGTTPWTHLVASGVAPAGAVAARLYLESGHNAGAVWFDDVTFSWLAPSPAASPAVISALSVSPVSADFVTRSGSRLLLAGRPFRFAGPNIYWLGLDENEANVGYPTPFRVDDALATARAMGATVVRAHTLGISTGCSLCVEPALNVFNDTALAHIDYAIATARAYGLRLIIPLTDNYRYYHGGLYNFTTWRNLPPGAFYTNATVIRDFEQYIAHLLNHVNVYMGLAYKDDPTIMAWETGNELYGAPAQWTQTVADYIKGLDPHHLVSDGNAGIYYPALGLPNVDLYTAHYYPMDAAGVTKAAAAVRQAGKAFFVGEFDWTNRRGGSALDDFLTVLQNTPSIAGDLYWSLLGHDDGHGFEQHTDGYTLHYVGDTGAMRARATLLRAHAYAMSGLPVPPDAVSSVPAITGVALRSGHNVLAWRGAVGAASYTVETAPRPSGPWAVVCQRCADDETTPWTDPSSLHAGHLWYRVTPYAADGTVGAASPPYQAE